MGNTKINRRNFVKLSAATGAAGVLGTQHGLAVASGGTGAFKFEVDFPEVQWRAMFNEEVYKILREGDTEWPKSSKWWDDYSDGQFSCIGCGLENFESVWRADIDKGWVFFSQSVPNSLLMGIDGLTASGMADEALPATIEVHCRRCGSHMGHLLKVDGQVVHCINGKALNFVPA